MAEMFTNAAAYERLMGRWSRRLAPLFLDFSGVHSAQSVLDVGCGTGSLTCALAQPNPGEPLGWGVLTARPCIRRARPRAGVIGRSLAVSRALPHVRVRRRACCADTQRAARRSAA